MIYLLKGKIHSKDHKSVVININGIGFRVFCSERTLNELAKNDNEVEVFTYHYLRENAMELYGFLTAEERDFFEVLISISGIGPKGALNILSLATLDELKEAIQTGREEILTKVSGIGKKLAKKIIIELSSKIDTSLCSEDSSNEMNEDLLVIEALVNMGYQARESRDALREIPKDVQGVGARVKEALKILGRK